MKIKKYSYKALPILMTAFGIANVCQAAVRGNDGGGGAQIESAFRLRGYKLISQIKDNAVANGYCSADVMQSALDHANIRIVDTLTDPATGKPVGQNLDAWSRPGDIQLLKSSWENLVGTTSNPWHEGKSIDVLVIHEIDRATGSCNDDRFVISEKVDSQISGSPITDYSEAFQLAYGYDNRKDVPGVCDDHTSFYGLNTDGCGIGPSAPGATPRLLCDQPSSQLSVGSRITCLSVSISNDYVESDSLCTTDIIAADSAKELYAPYYSIETRDTWDNAPANLAYKHCEKLDPNDFSQDFNNQSEYVTPEHPLLIVHDIQNGKWSVNIR